MRIRAEVVRFLEAQTMLTLADARRRTADAERRNADAECRRAWAALTVGEQAMVNQACSALNEPEMHRASTEGVQSTPTDPSCEAS